MGTMRIWVGEHRRLTLFVLTLTASLVVIAALSATLLNDAANNRRTTPIVKGVIAATGDPNSPVAIENRQPGTTAWNVDRSADPEYLQAYTGSVSAAPGQDVKLYVSAITPVTYALNVYRLGWYQGTGGRLYYTAPVLTAAAQGYWIKSTGLRACATCRIDPFTHLTEADWAPSFTLHIGATWPSGVYLLKLTAPSRHAETNLPLVVRADTQNSAILADLPVNTYQAYNLWGDYSLYGQRGSQSSELTFVDRAYQVSFDRPYDGGAGAEFFFPWDIQSIRWLERNNLDVTYTTDVDVSEHPESLLRHRVYIALGHDEYWTMAMRNGIEYARDLGVSLAFFGANDSFWQARLAPDAVGTADRTLVCYKIWPGDAQYPVPATLDPLYPTHPELVTARWRDPLINRPENGLLGAMYLGDFHTVNYVNGKPVSYAPDWVVNKGAALSFLLAGTGLHDGEHVPDILGYEIDGVVNNGATPPGLEILASSPVISFTHHLTADTTIYVAKSGALVFDAGSIWWSWGLDDYYFQDRVILKTNPKMQQLTLNILGAMLAASPTAPSDGTNVLPTPTAAATPTLVPSPTPTRVPTATPKPAGTGTPTATPAPTH